MVGFDSSSKTLDGRFVDSPLKVIILDVSFVEMFAAIRPVFPNIFHHLRYHYIQLVVLN